MYTINNTIIIQKSQLEGRLSKMPKSFCSKTSLAYLNLHCLSNVQIKHTGKHTLKCLNYFTRKANTIQ